MALECVEFYMCCGAKIISNFPQPVDLTQWPEGRHRDYAREQYPTGFYSDPSVVPDQLDKLIDEYQREGQHPSYKEAFLCVTLNDDQYPHYNDLLVSRGFEEVKVAEGKHEINIHFYLRSRPPK